MGYTASRKDLKAFLEQRGHTHYKVVPFKKKSLDDDIIRKIDNSSELDYYFHDWLLFRDEEDYFIESMCQYIHDLETGLHQLVAGVRFLRLTDKEKKILKTAFVKIREVVKYLNSDDECVEFEKVLDINKMVRHII